MKTLKNKLIPNFLKKYIIYYQDNGLKLTIEKFGIKLILGVFIFYLIRDSILYIIIPYFALKGIFNF
jgi:hypothetical protein|tara:strand:- start:3985 stop:4185 length:201 start_codon:yes stop_codon:yes gene_type:complete